RLPDGPLRGALALPPKARRCARGLAAPAVERALRPRALPGRLRPAAPGGLLPGAGLRLDARAHRLDRVGRSLPRPVQPPVRAPPHLVLPLKPRRLVVVASRSLKCTATRR